MVQIVFERLVARSVARRLSNEIDLAGVKTTVEKLLKLAIVGSILILVGVSALLYILNFGSLIAALGGMGASALFLATIYLVLEFKIDGRKTRLEAMLPDYLQIASANLRSGIALDRAMLLAARPEFGFLSEDIKEMNRGIFGGESFDVALRAFAARYRSLQLNHAVRMILEALRYGGAIADLLEQISKDMRSQQMIQKEVAGQMLMYSIFIAFAGLIAAPVLYGLTSQMIVITDSVWKGILASNPAGLPTAGVSFLKPSPPQISPQTYYNFALFAIILICGFASLIMSAIASGSVIKGIRYVPIFIIVGLLIFIVVQSAVGSLFTGIGSVGGA